jgi:hypothetical protein
LRDLAHNWLRLHHPRVPINSRAAEMVTEQTDFEDWPEADPIRMAALPLIQHIFAVTAPDSPARAAAMGEVLGAVVRIRAVLARPTIN